ncbi:SusC/RagA family TonB-linked outer membrane protein [Candidatus Kaistella beijingensis]|uniref:SusC/RagA family TonB-linked outer membrane protein n=1 Tax=Candidatus Kaistella beijingensis TaxID=2820270 RepID=UPI001CC7183A|nr:SusC/RagA family TonB-linked outer membrane protein [Candidatus Kaistella beijingensis]UBB88654.1 SusC/RagA family TonB-linked outer membrane protein [Candidatus Kaistella beijingensis]
MKSNTIKVTCIAALFFLGIGVSAQKNDTLTREKKIEEVVMIGYGTAKKSDLTGSVATVNAASLKAVPVSNVAEALTGKVAGLTVTTTEGSPDAEISLRVRGGGSVTQDSSPLIIVDGFPVNSMSDVSPSDIENVSILKDASSTAIYGSRGSNGVILITTKSGRTGKVTGQFNSYMGFRSLANKIDVLSPYDYAKWQYENALLLNNVSTGYNPYFLPFNRIGEYKSYTPIDWQERIYGRTGTTNSNDFSLRGGSESTSFSLNLANILEEGIMIGSKFRRDNISFNVKNKPKSNLDLSLTLRYSGSKIEGSGANDQKEFSSADARLRHSVGYSPIDIPALTTDDTDDAVAGYLVNPYLAVEDNNRKQDRKLYSIQAGLGWTPIKNLRFQTNIGTDFNRYKDYRFYGRSTYYVQNIPSVENQGKPALIFSNREDQSFRIANTLNYDFKQFVGDKHSLKVMVGQEFINTQQNILTNTVHGYPKLFSFDDAMNLSSQGKPQSVDNFYFADDRLLSFFSRLNYEFANKYLLTATIRGDASSKFLGDNKWGYFPSVALGWKVNAENFLNDVSWLNLLKLRASYGEAGNNNILSDQTKQLFQSTANSWINNVFNYWSPSKLMANPDLKWETTVAQNVGLDYELFDRRVSGTFEVYKNLNKDLLILFPTTGTGYDAQFRNMGEVQNKGIEASLSVDALKKDDYSLNFAFNISMNQNKINSLGDGMTNFRDFTNWTSSASVGTDFIVEVGQPVGLMYGFKSAGRYEVSDFDYNSTTGTYTLKAGVPSASSVVGAIVPGSMKLQDINGDGKVDIEDRTIIGNPNPKHTGGFNINATFKNFDLGAAFNWSYGNDVYNANKIEFSTSPQSSPAGQYRNLSTVMADGVRWTNIDASGNLVTDPTALAALNANTTMWSPYQARYVFSDWAVEDGSFLRLNTVTLGYTLPESFVRSINLSKIRLYASAYNVFVWTKYSGLDPEVSTRRARPTTPGVDYSPYPKSRQVVFGLNFNF